MNRDKNYFQQKSLIDNNEVLTKTYDISSGNETFISQISTGSISLSILAADLTGTLDATVKIYAGNTTTLAESEQVGSTITLSATPFTELVIKDLWNSAYMFVDLTVNNCTGGSLKLTLTLK